MKQFKKAILSRRDAVRQAVAAAGLSAIFKMTEGPVEAQGRGGRGGQDAAGGAGQAPGGAASGGGYGGTGRGANVHYGPITGPVNKLSAPSDLRITDMRACTIATQYDYNLIRLDTNQGVYGLGEVRDNGNKNLALMLKQFVVGRNPLDITGILRSIRTYAADGRQGGGYSSVDLALHDIVGKVYGVPVWRLLGDKKRDRIRMYCDTTTVNDPKAYAQHMLMRKQAGYTFFKMDLKTIELIGDRPGAVNSRGTATTKGLAMLCEFIQAIRDVIGDAPLSADHFGDLDIGDCIRYARAFEPYDLSWAEDMLQVGQLGSGSAPHNWRAYKEIKSMTSTPLGGFEDLFGLEEGFKPFLDNQAINVVHADPATSGMCIETKRIADYAWQFGIPTALHLAGSPVATMGGVHIAAAINSFVAMECHAADFMSWWQELVTGIPKPIIDKGYIAVSDAPGLGIELNEPVIKEHLRYPGYFEPTTAWDNVTARPQNGVVGYPHFNPKGVWTTDPADR